ncbi:MAG: hypothetical protein ACTSRR_11770 [Candidatus Heimdallarchaeaceae archaeon]
MKLQRKDYIFEVKKVDIITKREEINVVLIKVDDVSDMIFPFFTSYKLSINDSIQIYGFFLNEEMIAVSAVIPDSDLNNGSFYTYGSPIIYVFEVREDKRGLGYGKKCVELLIEKVLESDTVILSCTPFVAGFWEKLGFELKFIDQSLYMHRMMFEKKEKKEIKK